MSTESKVEGAEASPISTSMTDEEVKVMVEVFSKMGVKPKATTKAELEKWMADYVHGLGLLPPGLPPPLPFATPVKATPSKPPTSALFMKTEDTTAGTSTPVTTSSSPFLPSAGTSAAGTIVATRKPWLIKFAGVNSEGYILWRHQLRSLIANNHLASDIADAIRSSLHGKAGDIVANLGTDASVDDIIRKMDSMYGEVDEEEDLLHVFYGARQEPNESVADWGYRLETTIALLKNQGPLPRPENQMLRNRLWKGLRKDLQDLSGYKYDQVDDFDELRIVLRRIEKQQQDRSAAPEKKPRSTTAKSAQPSSDTNDLRIMLQKLTDDVKALKDDRYGNRNDNKGRNNANRDRYDRENQRRNESMSGGTSDYRKRGHRGYPSETSHNNVDDRQSYRYHPQPHQQPSQVQDDRRVPTCYRCGQPGHIVIGCRVRTDFLKKPQDF